jgi:hypothetical protein
VLVDDAMVASWIRQGLPSDPTSVQNGTILVNSERWPLMVDPQLQGVLWIKEREAKNGLQVGRRPPRAARPCGVLPDAQRNGRMLCRLCACRKR